MVDKYVIKCCTYYADRPVNGLGLDVEGLKKLGRPALLMCFVPASLELIGMLIVGPTVLGLTILEAAILELTLLM